MDRQIGRWLGELVDGLGRRMKFLGHLDLNESLTRVWFPVFLQVWSIYMVWYVVRGGKYATGLTWMSNQLLSLDTVTDTMQGDAGYKQERVLGSIRLCFFK